jgi:hypothetical protein
MSRRESVGRGLRSLWATIAAIALLGMGVALIATRYQQSQLENDATRDARKLAETVLQPMLEPSDVQGPVRGPRYDELLASVREDVLAGPINAVKVYRGDGTIVFATDPALVGDKAPAMRSEVHSVISGTAQSEVVGESYRTLTSLTVGSDQPVIVAAELDQAHPPIVERAKDRWYPWAVRGAWVAGIFVVLYLATALFFGVLAWLGRSAARRKQTVAATPKAARPRVSKRAEPDPSMPAYMQPNFREEVEARRQVETELAQAVRERAELQERLRRLEIELEEARRQANGLETNGHEAAERVLP